MNHFRPFSPMRQRNRLLLFKRNVNLIPAALVCCFLGVVFPISASEIQLLSRESSIKFTGHATAHDFHGEAQQFRGNAQIDPEKADLVTGANLVVRTAKMTTFEGARDQNMWKWLQVEEYPEAKVEITRISVVQGVARAATEKSPARFLAGGSFTLHGVTKVFEARVEGWRNGRKLFVEGETAVDTTTFNLPIIRQLVLTVDRKVDVHVRLVFELPPEWQK